MNVKIKIMPEKPNLKFDEIKESAKNILNSRGAAGISFEEEDIAFGLKALIVTFQWDEEKEIEETENLLRKIEGIGSLDIIDMRRAIG